MPTISETLTAPAWGTEMFPEGVAVVIGGSGGVGRAICRQLATCGTDLAFTYRSNTEAAEKLVQDIRAVGREAAAYQLDITDSEAVRAFFETATGTHGRLTTVIIASGADIKMKYVADVEPEEWRDAIMTDVIGAFNVSKHAIHALRAGGGGSIVALSTAAMARHAPTDILSIGPKGSVEALVRGIAREEGRNGIRANIVGLGVIDGGLMDRFWDQLSPEAAKVWRTSSALKRIGTMDEAANAVVFLASQKSSFISGQSLLVDGGWTA